MHRTIQELAAGQCDIKCPAICFSEEKLELNVTEGQSYSGTFTIKSTNGIPMCGRIYSSNLRMECLNPQFSGTEAVINYKFHSEGMEEGDSSQGEFYAVCNGGEYDLAFEVSVSKAYPQSSIGTIDNIFEFANLARKSYEEAAEVFGKPEFVHLFKPQEQEERLGYAGLCRRPCTRTQVEEFLVMVKKKERIVFEIEEGEREFHNVTKKETHHITLKKNTWGYTVIEMSSDAEFALPVKGVITSEDFVGSHAVAEYMILPEKLHAGKNYATLTFRDRFRKESLEICVICEGEEDEVRKEKRHLHLERQKRRAELLQAYTDFRLHHMAAGVWAKTTCEKLDFLINLEPDNPRYGLYKAQTLLVNQQRQEAEWILESFRQKNREKDTPLYAYYLYLCTLAEPEPAYVNQLAAQITEIYQKNKENPFLLWILLFVDEEFNHSSSRKLEAITRELDKGCASPILYAEAYSLLSREPYLIHRGDRAERRILYWAVRHNALKEKLAEQIRGLIPHMMTFDMQWYQIMSACYEKYPSNKLLQEICGYCIRTGRYGKNYMKWYAAGIREELRIGGLYEAWLLSADKKQLQKLPKVITMYFQYHSNLPYQQRAMLYRAIIKNKQNMKQVYQNYYQSIESFAIEQMKLGRIDRNLAVIYEEILTPALMNEESAEWLGKIIFSCRLICKEEKAVRLVVRQPQLCREQVVPLINQGAYVNVYGSACHVLCEDARGRRFVPETEIVKKPVIDVYPFLKQGMKAAKNKLPYMLGYFERKSIWQTYDERDLPYLQELMESEKISPEYREEIRIQLISYYYENYTGDMLDKFLDSLSFAGLKEDIRGRLTELLVARKNYDKAYELVCHYGSENLSAAKLLFIVCNRIEQIAWEQDAILLGLCQKVFRRGKYNDKVLEYMCRYFQGNLKELAELWKTAREFEVECHELEERCITQFLYTGSYSGYMQQIFESYDKKVGRRQLTEAYLSQMSHKYLTGDVQVSDYVFRKISTFLEEGDELNEPCRLGFLKWCSSQAELSDGQKEQAERILRTAVEQGKYFPFYKELPQEFARKYMYYDRTFLEYRTVPDTRVIISYGKREGNGYIECDMTRMYSGIFVKSFVAFYGEEIPYYIKEEINGEFAVTQSGHIPCSEWCPGIEDSRYHLLNDIIISWRMKDGATAEKLIEQYQQEESMVQKNFTII